METTPYYDFEFFNQAVDAANRGEVRIWTWRDENGELVDWWLTNPDETLDDGGMAEALAQVHQHPVFFAGELKVRDSE